MKKTVSLHNYRTPGVRVFSGYDRGKVVAEAIKEAYGDNVSIEVPADVICIATGFRQGFASVLPRVEIPSRYDESTPPPFASAESEHE